jgi:hypothetical protein
VPPGPEAKAEVVAARSAAERARVRNVRDMIMAPERRCAFRSVTKVQQIGIQVLPKRLFVTDAPCILCTSLVTAPALRGTFLPPGQPHSRSLQP